MSNAGRIPGSFRDPSGHLFVRDGIIYRQINPSYREHYDALIASGLYDALVAKGRLLPHTLADVALAESADAYRVIQPEPVPFVSYPYEWCFSQLKDAAVVTLDVQRAALDRGMTLKDASAYNIQFLDGRPVLIDTLSFEKYDDGSPWVAYRQFCQHFLAPLALMAYADVRLGQLLRVHIDGVPLDLASSLLPVRTRFNVGLFTHVHLHARAQKRYAGRRVTTRRKMPRTSLLGLIDSLGSTIRRLKWRMSSSEWGDYYADTNYSPEAMRHKSDAVTAYIDKIHPRTVWDLGANTGEFSQIAAERGALTIAFDVDPVAVERHYLALKPGGDTPVLPLWLDLTNPSPSTGWQNTERMSFFERGPADLVLALALVHHLAISNNVPLERLAEFFAATCQDLVVEFVPKHDPQVARLLATRQDIFATYDQSSFEMEFNRIFAIEDATAISGTERTLYHMRRRS